MNLVTQKYTKTDRSAVETIFRSNVPIFFDTSDYEDFLCYIDTQPEGYYVVKSEGDILGCGGVRVDNWGIAWFDWLMVSRERHRMGIGSFLINFRLGIARAENAWCVLLTTANRTEALYKRFGFCRIEHVAKDGNEHEYVHMRKILLE